MIHLLLDAGADVDLESGITTCHGTRPTTPATPYPCVYSVVHSALRSLLLCATD